MRIEVTDSDIAHGEPHNGYRCPIALAITRQFPNVSAVHVNVVSLQIGDDSPSTPQPARRFIDRFDKGLQVKPFRFELHV